MASAVVVLSGCSSGDPAAETDTTGRVEAVRTIELDYTEISREATYTAQLQAYREVHFAPASPGRIERIHTETGDRVSEGQLLVEMDRTQLHQAMIQLQSLETDYRRLDTLRRVGSISQQQFDQVATQYELAKSNVEFLEKNVRMMAPFSGRVSGKYFEEGEMFSGAPNTAAGKAAILSIVQTNQLKAMVGVSERYFPFVRPGMEVHVSLDVYPGEVFPGKISVVNPTVDSATRSFQVEVTLNNPGEKLRPGMFARATMVMDRVDAFLVPALAVLKLQGSNERFVFLEDNGTARRVVVELGARFDDKVELVSDQIKPGDRLIVAGQARLENGVSVRAQ